ncbi:subclass B3 metallo-beta-lactamase [Lysobacter sp. A286]
MRAAFALAALLALPACADSSPQPAVEPALPTVTPANVPECPADAGVMDGWNDRAPPRKIFGNVYYVGTCGITALLVTSLQGHILLDGATEPGGPAIAANIEALGFKLADVKFILNSHEHSDHAGGLAYLQRVTDASVLAREPSAATLERGASDRGDPQFGVLEKFPPVANVQVLPDDQTVRIGDLALTAHATPGHAPGSTSWTWASCESSHCLQMVYADSLSAASDKTYLFSDHADYLAAFHRSIDTVASLPCDILISPHPLVSDLFARFDGKAPLMDADSCKRYADDARTNLEQRLQDEKQHSDP